MVWEICCYVTFMGVGVGYGGAIEGMFIPVVLADDVRSTQPSS